MMKKYALFLAAVLLAFLFCPIARAETDSQTNPQSLDSTAGPAAEAVSVNNQAAVDSFQAADKATQENVVSPTSATQSLADTSQEIEDSSEQVPVQKPLVSQEDAASTTDIPPVSDQVEKLTQQMTLRQKITQMLMPDFRKWQQEGQTEPADMTVLNDEVAKAIDQYDFGGAILFAENVKGTSQTLALTQAIQEAALANKANNGNIPLLLAIDQEGGIVYRLGSGTALPGNMALGAADSPELAKQAGQIIGRELSALGINVNFAPVLDTNNNPQNPIIGLRSFSSDPNLVAKLGIPMMQGIQEYNVAVAAKHFPGHGDTAVDSHTGLPLVDKSYVELEKLELLPFKRAVDQGVDMLMTAHIQYPQIEKDTVVSKESGEKIYIPATLSDDIITGIVRQKFGYKGVVVTDAMGMDAIAKNFGESEAAVMAIKAGVDIVLMPANLRSQADLAKLDKIIEDIEQAVKRGEIAENRLNESVKRILTLKEKRGILNFSLADRTAEKAEAVVGSELNRNLERKIAASAVTVVKNDDTVLPFKVKSGDRILLLGAYDNELPGLELGIKRLIADGVIPADVSYEAVRYSRDTTLDSLKSKMDQASHIIVISEIGRQSQLASDMWLTKIPTQVVDYANASDKKAAVMSISKPYDVANYPKAKAILAVYGNKGMDPTESLRPDNAFGPNIPAGVEVIFNGREHQGKLPVSIPAIQDGVMSESEIAYPLGHGLLYSDPVKHIRLSLPENVNLGSDFKIQAVLEGLNGLEKNDYRIIFKVDTLHFRILPNAAYTIDGDTVTIDKNAQDTSPAVLEFRALAPGQYAPITSLSLQDSLGRTFTMGAGYYAHELVQVQAMREQNLSQNSGTVSDENRGTLEAAASRMAFSHQTLAKVSRNTAAKEELPQTGEKSMDLTSGLLVLFFAAFGLISSPLKKKS